MVGRCVMDLVMACTVGVDAELERQPPEFRHDQAQEPEPAGRQVGLGLCDRRGMAQALEAHGGFGKDDGRAEPPERGDAGIEIDAERHGEQDPVARADPLAPPGCRQPGRPRGEVAIADRPPGGVDDGGVAMPPGHRLQKRFEQVHAPRPQSRRPIRA